MNPSYENFAISIVYENLLFIGVMTLVLSLLLFMNTSFVDNEVSSVAVNHTDTWDPMLACIVYVNVFQCCIIAGSYISLLLL